MILVPCDIVQKQIVAVEFCRAVRSKKIEIAVCSKDFWLIFDEWFFLLKKHWKKSIATCSGFHGYITWSNMRLRMFSWPICSAQCNSIGVDIVLQKGSTPAAYNREIYSVNWSSYQRWLSTKTCAQIGWFCCNAFCSDSTCTHPVCSSSLHVGLFWEGEGLQPFYLAALFLEQVQNLIPLSFCCLFTTSTFLPWAGSCCIFLLTCSFINHCCQHKFAHRMDSAAMLSVVIRLVPSTL